MDHRRPTTSAALSIIGVDIVNYAFHLVCKASPLCIVRITSTTHRGMGSRGRLPTESLPRAEEAPSRSA
jgi:hypothetical protein